MRTFMSANSDQDDDKSIMTFKKQNCLKPKELDAMSLVETDAGIKITKKIIKKKDPALEDILKRTNPKILDQA